MKSRPLWVVVACILVLVILVGGWLLYVRPARANGLEIHRMSQTTANSLVDQGTDLQGKPAPNFTLTDQYGKTIRLSQFKGKTVVLAFVDSECTNICPLTTASMVDALRMLGPDAAKHVQLLGVNANPTKVSVADVKQYSVDHDMMNSWHFLTGSDAKLKSVWHDFGIYAALVNGEIDHTPALYIIDPAGREQVVFITPAEYGAVTSQASVIAKQIARFLPSGVHASVKSVDYQATQMSPQTTVQLPGLTVHGIDGKVAIGPGKPKLMVFFASWAPGTQEALQYLTKWSSQPGNPSVIAVDVAPSEPNSAAAVSTLKSIPELNYPVAVDQTGQFADAYQAADVMWFSLVDSKGNIVWSQDAWSTAGDFDKGVSAALRKMNG